MGNNGPKLKLPASGLPERTVKHSTVVPKATAFSSFYSIAPLMERMIGTMGGEFEIRAEGRRVFSTSSYDALAESDHSLSRHTFPFEVDGKDATCNIVSRDSGAQELADLLDQKLKFEVARGVMHDINNLLTPLNGNRELLHYALLRGDVDEIYKIMYDLRQIIELLSQLSTRSNRLLLGKQDVSTENLSDVCDVVIALTKKPIQMLGKEIEVINLVSPTFDVAVVLSDLQLAMWNILLNAANHGIVESGRIDIRALRDGDLTYLLIENNGIPIPEEVQATLLRKPITGGSGRGVGLYSSVRALQAFGGDMTFTSNQFRTTFRISLPSENSEI